ncbi:(2Fe-2S)-binding protein [Anaeroselena agilis]|uniref:(2Fe-2S)-binding protein n=1 Tax=Anaeroselena agilis TaxID=3063788 RepID=A0ABU3P365_9FIRM|nr:(2Fe-2S)-binding protein [Selenomonadales bacterium 4137-cl]
MSEAVIRIKFRLNGTMRQAEVLPHQTLTSLIREHFGLLGTKISCGEGECGACTVILDGKAVNSCIILAPEVDGRDVLTIEGLSTDGELHPIQKAFIDEGAVQCGFCTPGMIMSTKALLDEHPEPTEEMVREALAGNLCRCTGYHRIINAVMAASNSCKCGGKDCT